MNRLGFPRRTDLSVEAVSRQRTLARMLIPKADRKAIHEYLFRGDFCSYHYIDDALTIYAEGVLVAKKDFNLPKHNEIDTKNLYVRQQ